MSLSKYIIIHDMHKMYKVSAPVVRHEVHGREEEVWSTNSTKVIIHTYTHEINNICIKCSTTDPPNQSCLSITTFPTHPWSATKCTAVRM